MQRYTKNAGDGVLVCILSASRNEERLSFIGARRSARPLEYIFPGHALHEKGLQRQIGVGTLVSRQQTKSARSPGDKPLMNRLSTGRFVPPPVYIVFLLLVLAKRRLEQLFTVSWRARGTVGFRADRNVGTLFCPASPRPAVRRAPRRPDPPVVCSGFGFDRFRNSSLTIWVGNGFLIAIFFLMTRTRYAVKPVGADGSDQSRRRQSLKSRTVPGAASFSLSQTAGRRTAQVRQA